MIFTGVSASRVITNEPLSEHSSIEIGGPADYYFEAKTEEELVWAIESAKKQRLDFFVLGDGSNILFSDTGYRGLVVRFVAKSIHFSEPLSGRVEVKAEAAVSWDTFVSLCVQKGLSGVECLSGIPGSVGATPVQNIGAYGQEVGESIVSVRVYDTEQQRVVDLSKKECGFGYRTSNFKRLWRKRYVVMTVTFSLLSSETGSVKYEELRSLLAERGEEPTLEAIRAAVLTLRKKKAMVLSTDEPYSRSVGSFFTNPVISLEQSNALDEQLKVRNLKLVRWPSADGKVKLSAAWLIEQAGFPKGYQRGSVGLSSKQALAIVNLSHASANDVINLATDIQAAVFEHFGVRLFPEAECVGFDTLPSVFRQ
ncbi:MAG: UDP-N-acetylmuramate dehydrogenase [Patescibacteria group bacterium]|jgi:UDP-N-acetylmuramate dehydrogenase